MGAPFRLFLKQQARGDHVFLQEDSVVPEADFMEMGAGSGLEEAPIKHEDTLRHRIHKALQVAAKALENAHGSAEKAEAKDAVKRALADAGVADADNAGTIAWANRNLKV